MTTPAAQRRPGATAGPFAALAGHAATARPPDVHFSMIRRDLAALLGLFSAAGARKVELSVARYSSSQNGMGGFFFPRLPPAFPRLADIQEELSEFEASYSKLLWLQAQAGNMSVYLQPVDFGQFIHRLIFLDDVNVKDLAQYQEHAHVALETSPENHQLWLLLDRRVSPEVRDTIRRHYVRHAGADPGAGGLTRRWTRAPGSINWKPGKGCFITRVASSNLAGAPINCSEFEQGVTINPPQAPQRYRTSLERNRLESSIVGLDEVETLSLAITNYRKKRNEYTNDASDSGNEISAVMSLIRKEVPEEDLFAALVFLARRRDKTDARGYAARTLVTAKRYLAKSIGGSY